MARLEQILQKQEMYAFTVNAFPYGEFHTRPVKEKVYQPDWGTRARLDYTVNVAHILDRLLPQGVDGSISTVPVTYGKTCPANACRHLLLAAENLQRTEEDSGRRIRLALEPEPDCFLNGDIG